MSVKIKTSVPPLLPLSYVISVPSIVELGPDIVSYICSGMSSVSDRADILRPQYVESTSSCCPILLRICASVFE